MSNLACSILIADDDENIRNDLADLLKDTGATLLFAGTAKETLQRVELDRPSIVLLDIRFPDCNDLSVLKQIKHMSPTTEVLIISSQTSDVSKIVDAIKCGAFDYIPKPFVGEELHNRIEKAYRLSSLVLRQDSLIQQLQEAQGAGRLSNPVSITSASFCLFTKGHFEPDLTGAFQCGSVTDDGVDRAGQIERSQS